MRKIVLPFLAVFVCLASVMAIRAISATTNSPIAALLPVNVPSQARTLTFAERVKYERAIEEVYWRHRIWPKENSNPKPSLDAVMSQPALEKKVQGYLRDSQALKDYPHRPITADQLQAEMDRMAQHTNRPEVLRELFEALENDPFVIAECLVRPVLTERLLNSQVDRGTKERTEVGLKESSPAKTENQMPDTVMVPTSGYSLPTIADVAGGCRDDTWTATAISPTGRELHTAVWTGTEMIVWGGFGGPDYLNTGGRYNPITDSWTATSTTNAPTPRANHTAVWTGSEMIIWGGHDSFEDFGTGASYNPVTNSWAATSATNAPTGRRNHTAVWTGSEMIVWGGDAPLFFEVNTGGRYNPSTDSWTATSTTNAPSARIYHTAVWTGSEMIVWGGTDFITYFITGGRYDPGTDSWTATSTLNAPQGRDFHTAVWSGSEMIVWGGGDGANPLNTGGRYNPATDSWTVTNTTNAPTARSAHTAVWTGTQMIVWGGNGLGGGIGFHGTLNTGGKYNPVTDSWRATHVGGGPSPRVFHTAVWTGNEMIIWGGGYVAFVVDTGGRYCAPLAGSQLGNISTRAFVQTGDNVMIGGFIVQGAQPKRVIIRAIGPELTQHGVPNAMSNPTLELHDVTGALIASNDNWQTTIIGGIITSDQRAEIRASGHAPRDGRESAIIADLPPGNYTAIVRGVNDTTGVALAEVYDISGNAISTLGNISTRSFVQTGDNVMIGGFIVQGTQPKRVILRAIGPELAQHGVPSPLADPILDLHNNTGALIGSNDNWMDAPNVQEIIDSGHAPTDPRESAIVTTLPPGNYTAIVRGVNNITGVALVEVYDLD
jgi:N-acetylneuraminic acid mutarotase